MLDEATNAGDPAQRPTVGVAHVVLHTNRMDESARFMHAIGMRAIFNGPAVSVYEMRGGTHLTAVRSRNILRHKGICSWSAS